jgi:hypothetical protein
VSSPGASYTDVPGFQPFWSVDQWANRFFFLIEFRTQRFPTHFLDADLGVLREAPRTTHKPLHAGSKARPAASIDRPAAAAAAAAAPRTRPRRKRRRPADGRRWPDGPQHVCGAVRRGAAIAPPPAARRRRLGGRPGVLVCPTPRTCTPMPLPHSPTQSRPPPPLLSPPHLPTPIPNLPPQHKPPQTPQKPPHPTPQTPPP